MSAPTCFRACEATILGFFRALDEGDVEGIAAAMAPEGVWNRQGSELRGRDAVRTAAMARDAERVTCHVVTNLVIDEVAPSKMRARFYLTAYDNGGDAALRLVAIRRCEDRLALTPQGWLIESKRSERLLPPA